MPVPRNLPLKVQHFNLGLIAELCAAEDGGVHRLPAEEHQEAPSNKLVRANAQHPTRQNTGG